VQKLDHISSLKTETHFNQRIKEGFYFSTKPFAVVSSQKQPIGPSLATSHFILCVCAFSHFVFMDATPPT